MKKFFAIAILAVASLTANAQAWIGGAASFNWAKSKADGAKATTSWELAPEIGYDLNEDWAVAIKLGVNSTKTGDADAVTGFKISPFARYKFANIDDLTFFIDGGLSYTTYGKHNGSSFGIGVQPGLAYKVADGVSLEAKFGYFGWKTYDKEAGYCDKFGFGVDTEVLSFGVFFDI